MAPKDTWLSNFPEKLAKFLLKFNKCCYGKKDR